MVPAVGNFAKNVGIPTTAERAENPAGRIGYIDKKAVPEFCFPAPFAVAAIIGCRCFVLSGRGTWDFFRMTSNPVCTVPLPFG